MGNEKKRGDTRTVLKESGCPSLYIKEIIRGGRKVSCFAFRTGTSNISSVVSSTLQDHEWEGVCLSHRQHISWENDRENGLVTYLFSVLASNSDISPCFKDIREELLDELKNEKIDILTLEQGTADWHKGRQFSFTSSQADGTFRKTFIVFQDDENWFKVAKYLEGENYENRKFIISYLYYWYLYL